MAVKRRRPSGFAPNTVPWAKSGGRRRTRRNVETQLQISLVRFFHKAVPASQALLLAIPNGEKRDAATASILKAMGVKAGASDLILVLPNGKTAWIEVKRPEELVWNLETGRMNKVAAGELSDTQKAFKATVEGFGHEFREVRTIEEFARVLLEFGLLKGYHFP